MGALSEMASPASVPDWAGMSIAGIRRQTRRGGDLDGGEAITAHNPESALRRHPKRGDAVTFGWSRADQRVIDDPA